MNVKAYYQKIRELERALADSFVVIVSHDTPDGGNGGLLTEVPKHLAARMIADKRAHLASEDATLEFREKSAEAKRTAGELLLADQRHIRPMPASELRPSTHRDKE
jgi:D-serine deaminase-like pyridoxal phosphate-dependent protein